MSIINALVTLRQGAKLDTVHTLVNGQSVRMELLAERTGAAVERAASSVGDFPTESSGPTRQTGSGRGESI